ncbi:MAG: phage holin family protein [Caldilineaceae bacterium]|nr:phage holin family protein [Caldilineaceae bacterium]
MRRYLVQVLINALAITFVLILLPQVDIRPGNLPMSFVAGLLFSLVNTFIKPLVIILIGQLLIQTMGMLMSFISTVGFALLIWILPFGWAIDQPQWLWIVVAAGLMSLAVTLLDALLGLDQPQLDEEGRGQFVWQWLDRIPGWMTTELVENVRTEQVMRTIYRYGLDIALSPTPISRIRNRVEIWISGHPTYLAGLSTPTKVRLLLQELGPTYVKFGQMVSTQAENLPEEWAVELARLQNTVSPFPYEEVRAIIAQELGAPPEEIFATFEQRPLAAASMAQVHRATLPTGEAVAVKVQRPNIAAKMNADLRVMAKLVRVLESRVAVARSLNLTGMIEEFAIGARKEMDFQNEAFHARQLAANMSGISTVHIPHIDGERSSSRVLTMEFIDGVKITDTAAIDQAGLDRGAVAQTVVRALVKQILIDGFFHGDPHPGNIFIDSQSGAITFLDLGLIGELPPLQRFDLLDLLWSVNQGDPESLATAALRLTDHPGTLDERAFRADVVRAYDQYWVYTAGRISFAAMVEAIRNVLTAHGLRMNRNLSLAFKAITQAEGIAVALQPQMKWVEVAYEEVTTLLQDQFTVERVAEQVRTQAVRGAKELLRELPGLQDAVGQWLDQFRRGRFVVELNTDALADSVTHFSQSMRRVTVALILIGMLIGSAIASSLLVTLQDTQWAFLPILAMGIFILASLFSGIVVLRMLRAEQADRP